MKTIIFFTTLLIFLHATTYHMIGTEAKDGPPDPVLDVDGNPLLSQYIYKVLPGTAHGPGGINSRQLGNKNCTFGVSLELPGIGLPPLPVGFYQPDPIPGAAIRESTDTNIMFSTPTGCNSSGVWKVDRQDPSTGRNFIVTDGVAVTGSANNWFWIEKVENQDENKHYYKFRYCPQPPFICLRCPLNCTDLDFVDNKRAAGPLGFLALAETSYPFRFSRYEGHAERY